GIRQAEKLVPGRERGRSRQQKVLNVVKVKTGRHRRLLHLVEHRREGVFERQRLLDFAGRDKRVFAVFEEAGTLVLADELDEGRRVRLPICRESFELLEDRVEARCLEQLDRVIRVLVEIRIENALIL